MKKPWILIAIVATFVSVVVIALVLAERTQQSVKNVVDVKRVYMVGWREAVVCYQPSKLSNNENLWQEKNSGYACKVYYYISTQEANPESNGIVGSSTEWEVTKELFDQTRFGQVIWLPVYESDK